MLCSHCGAENPDDGDFSFCLKCGEDLERGKRPSIDAASPPPTQPEKPEASTPPSQLETQPSQLGGEETPEPVSEDRRKVLEELISTIMATPALPHADEAASPSPPEIVPSVHPLGAPASQPGDAASRPPAVPPAYASGQWQGQPPREQSALPAQPVQPSRLSAAGVGVLSPMGVAYGGFLVRLVAYFIDMLLLWSVGFVMFSLIGISAAVGTGEAVAAAMGVAWIGFLLVCLAYVTILPPALGATFGKLLLGYHIVDSDGRHIGFGRALGRALGMTISGIFLDIGFLWIIVDSKKQGWHDKIAGTYVVRKEFVRQ